MADQLRRELVVSLSPRGVGRMRSDGNSDKKREGAMKRIGVCILALAVVGGLIPSTLLTLLVLPVLYHWAYRDPTPF